MTLEKQYGLEHQYSILRKAEELQYIQSDKLINELILLLKRYQSLLKDINSEEFLSQFKSLCDQYPNESVLSIFQTHLIRLRTISNREHQKKTKSFSKA